MADAGVRVLDENDVAALTAYVPDAIMSGGPDTTVQWKRLLPRHEPVECALLTPENCPDVVDYQGRVYNVDIESGMTVYSLPGREAEADFRNFRSGRHIDLYIQLLATHGLNSFDEHDRGPVRRAFARLSVRAAYRLIERANARVDILRRTFADKERLRPRNALQELLKQTFRVTVEDGVPEPIMSLTTHDRMNTFLRGEMSRRISSSGPALIRSMRLNLLSNSSRRGKLQQLADAVAIGDGDLCFRLYDLIQIRVKALDSEKQRREDILGETNLKTRIFTQVCTLPDPEKKKLMHRLYPFIYSFPAFKTRWGSRFLNLFESIWNYLPSLRLSAEREQLEARVWNRRVGRCRTFINFVQLGILNNWKKLTGIVAASGVASYTGIGMRFFLDKIWKMLTWLAEALIFGTGAPWEENYSHGLLGQAMIKIGLYLRDSAIDDLATLCAAASDFAGEILSTVLFTAADETKELYLRPWVMMSIGALVVTSMGRRAMLSFLNGIQNVFGRFLFSGFYKPGLKQVSKGVAQIIIGAGVAASIPLLTLALEAYGDPLAGPLQTTLPAYYGLMFVGGVYQVWSTWSGARSRSDRKNWETDPVSKRFLAEIPDKDISQAMLDHFNHVHWQFSDDETKRRQHRGEPVPSVPFKLRFLFKTTQMIENGALPRSAKNRIDSARKSREVSVQLFESGQTQLTKTNLIEFAVINPNNGLQVNRPVWHRVDISRDLEPRITRETYKKMLGDPSAAALVTLPEVGPKPSVTRGGGKRRLASEEQAHAITAIQDSMIEKNVTGAMSEKELQASLNPMKRAWMRFLYLQVGKIFSGLWDEQSHMIEEMQTLRKIRLVLIGNDVAFRMGLLRTFGLIDYINPTTWNKSARYVGATKLAKAIVEGRAYIEGERVSHARQPTLTFLSPLDLSMLNRLRSSLREHEDESGQVFLDINSFMVVPMEEEESAMQLLALNKGRYLAPPLVQDTGNVFVQPASPPVPVAAVEAAADGAGAGAGAGAVFDANSDNELYQVDDNDYLPLAEHEVLRGVRATSSKPARRPTRAGVQRLKSLIGDNSVAEGVRRRSTRATSRFEEILNKQMRVQSKKIKKPKRGLLSRAKPVGRRGRRRKLVSTDLDVAEELMKSFMKLRF